MQIPHRLPMRLILVKMLCHCAHCRAYGKRVRDLEYHEMRMKEFK